MLSLPQGDLRGRTHEARSVGQKSCAGGCRSGRVDRARRSTAEVCALGSDARATARHRLPVRRSRRVRGEILRSGRRSSPPRLRRRDHGLARPGRLVASASKSAQRLRLELQRVRRRSPAVHEGDRASGLPAALYRAGAFDGRQHPAAQRGPPGLLVRAHDPLRAHDRIRGQESRGFRRPSPAPMPKRAVCWASAAAM